MALRLALLILASVVLSFILGRALDRLRPSVRRSPILYVLYLPGLIVLAIAAVALSEIANGPDWWFFIPAILLSARTLLWLLWDGTPDSGLHQDPSQ